MALVWFLMMVIGAADTDKIQTIKDGFLDFRPGTKIGPVFEGYPWWKHTAWQVVPSTGDTDFVDFTGHFSASEAAEEFKKRHQYRFRMSLKYTRLEPVYGIGTYDEEVLSVTIRFSLDADGSFSVEGGRLGLLHPQKQTWRYVPLSDKAVLSMLKAFYHDIDPYTALVNGLPYK